MKILISMFAVSVFLIPLSGMAADLTTDNTLYPSGKVMQISGSGYKPNEIVTLQVTHIDGSSLEGEAGQPWNVTADEFGSIQSSWETPSSEQPVDTLNLSGSGDISGEEGDAVFLISIQYYFDQLQNDATPSWSGGVINSNNSCYSESHSVPYRYLIKGLTGSSQHYITIKCGWTKAGIHGFDYFTDYDFSEAIGISGAGGTCGGTPPPTDCLPISSTFPFPDPTNTANYSGTIPPDFFPAGFTLDGPRNLSTYNATVDSVSNYWFSGTASDRIYNITVYFTVNSAGSVGFYWGGHMAQGTSSTWGISNGSGSISGAPIHMEAGILDGSGGTNVLPVQGGTICLPPDATITCDSDTVCTNSSYACTVPTPTSSTAEYTWTINGGIINSGQGTELIDYTVTATYPGSVMITVEACDTATGCPGDYCCNTDIIELPIGYCCDPPVAVCPDDTTIFACDLSQICLPGFDCNGTPTVIGGTLNGNQVCFMPVEGSNVITLICTNDCGDADTCVTHVTVTLNSPPVCSLPPNDTFFVCYDTTFNFSVSATDPDNNLVGCTMTSGDGSFDGSTWTFTTSGSGTYSATFECEDSCGATCGGTVSIVFSMDDNEPPVAICPSDITVNNDQGQCGAVVTFSVSATDNCPGVIVTANPASGNLFSVGTTAVEVIATDGGGNKDTCYFNVTVNDSEDPVAICPSDITTGNDQGQCGAVVGFSIDATDNCPGVTVVANPASGSFFGLGTTPVEVIATDAAGNKDTCYFNVTVNENEDPVAICPSDITVDNDPGDCGAVVSFSIDATDNCPGVTVAATPAAGSYFPVGTTSVEVIATDAVGNKDTCYFNVIVNDTEDPDITCPPDLAVECDGSSDPSSTGYASATDNCDPDPNITYADVQSGNVITRTWTATDMYNNSSQCGQIITIEPNTPPVCNVPNDTLIFLCTATEVCLPVSATDAEDNLVGCEVVNGIGYIDNGNWCYTPSGNESQTVVIKCTDICGEYCQESFQVEFEIYAEWAIIAVDRTGSMYLENPLGQSRLERAKALAHIDIDKLIDAGDVDYPGVYRVAVMYFNSTEGIVLSQMFTSDATTLHDAVDAIPGPKHDTPLAAAMCQAHCLFPGMPDCSQYLFVFTDGLENASQYFDICEICDPCIQHMSSGWNFDCDPTNPSTCTDWQICLYNIFATSGINMVHYFGEPINPFVKGAEILEDLYFLKATAEESQGQFLYYSDQDAPGYFCGDANRDFSVNVSDAVYIINYVFAGGEPPEPYVAGDANCDGTVNVSDAVWIINYVFVGANAPCDNDNDGVPDC